MRLPLLISILGLGGSLALPGAMRFDGSDDILHWDGAPAGLNFTNEITVSVWLNKEAGLAASAEFIGKGRLKNGNNLHWSLRNSSGKYEWNYAAPNATFHNFTTTATFLQTNVWQHIVVRWRTADSNTCNIYVDGSRVAGAWTANPVNSAMLTNNEPMRIGTTYAGSTTRGSIQEAAVWNAYLEEDEICALAKSRTRGTPLTIRRPALRGYWPLAREFPFFSTASGSNAMLDLSGYGQHLTPLNSPQMRPGHLAVP